MVRRPAVTKFAAREQKHRGQDQSATQQRDGREDFPEQHRGQQYRNNRLEVESIEASVGPMSLSPARKVTTAMTVAMSVIAATANQPALVPGQ